MAMFLRECPVYVIMIDDWMMESDAFLQYIRKKVEQFSHKVSSKMLHFQLHQHVPDRETKLSTLDQRQRNHLDMAETKENVTGRMVQQIQMTPLPLQVDAEQVLVGGTSLCIRSQAQELNLTVKN